jgi:dihydrodipicolinate reductase
MCEKDSQKELIEGIVTVRACECCGHHEIGMMTQNGEYIRLKPGMKITIVVEK